MKKIKIDEMEKEMFNSLWEMVQFEKDGNDVTKFPRRPEEMLDEFIHYLALKYNFDPNHFTVYDKKGNMIHSRMEKPKEFVN